MAIYAVLGATGTIGSHLAASLAQAGHDLILLARDQGKLEQTSVPISSRVLSAQAIDFQHSDGVKSAIETAVRDAGRELTELAGMINCIGSILLKPAHGTSDDEFRQTVEANLFTAFACVRSAGTLLRKQGGSVILFSSAAADIGLQNHEAIAAAKAGVIGLARAAAATYASSNIRINVISPGLTRTELTRRIWENPTNCAASMDMHALGRLGEPRHIVSAALWLLDPQNDWITGEVMHIDGGLSQLVPRRKA